jgi:hypothetical protein
MSLASERHVTLVIPELFGLPPSDEIDSNALPYPMLERLLARADRQPQEALHNLESVLFALFEIPTPAGEDLPVAAVTRMLDMGIVDQEWWLRADPVHLRPDRGTLVLADNTLLQLTAAEAGALVGEILEVFAADGWLLKAPRPDRWYLKLPRAPRLHTTALPNLVGRNVDAFLPRGDDGKAWHTILNEIQILLHTSKVNTEREKQGRLSVNSLWFWGGGRLPRIMPVRWTRLWSDEPVSLALARLAGLASGARPEDFAAWQPQAGAGRHLLVLDQLRAPAQYGETQQWSETLRRLEQDWLAPLYQALKDRVVAGVTIHSDAGESFVLGRGQARRWWRSPRPLASYRATALVTPS